MNTRGEKKQKRDRAFFNVVKSDRWAERERERSACNEKQPLEFLLVKIPILLFSPSPLVSRLEDMISSTSIYGMCIL